jgi:hypothetical protein
MPMLVLSGEKTGGTFLIEQAKLVAFDVRGQVVKGAGHWLIEEAPGSSDQRLCRVIFTNRTPSMIGRVAGLINDADATVSIWRGRFFMR